MTRSYYVARRLMLMLTRLVAVIGILTLLLIVGASALGMYLQAPVLAYVDFDISTQRRDLILLDFDHSVRIRRPLEIDVGNLDWTQQRLIAMSYGIGGEWQSYSTLAAQPVIETRGEHEFTWLLSPDERYLAYSGYDEDAEINQLYIEHLDEDYIDTFAGVDVSSHQPLLWSPDSSALIYQQHSMVGAGSLYTYAPETGSRTLIAEAAGDPAWSPDGRQILYTRYVGVSLTPRLEIFDLETGEHRPLLPEDVHNQHTGAWSPNGEWIALSYDDAIAVVRPDGSDLQVLTSPFFVSNPLWSPDSHSLIFIAGAGLTSLYKIDDVEAAIQQAQQIGGGMNSLVVTLDRQVYGVYPVWQPVVRSSS